MKTEQIKKLSFIAEQLNGPIDASPKWTAAWRAVARMLPPNGKFSTKLVESFNEFSEEALVRFRLYRNKNGTVEPRWDVAADWGKGRVVKLLWDFYFTNECWRRLKKCRKCRAWFVDHSRNHGKRFCKRECADLWWTRAQREKARKQENRDKL